jgi:hypothetical protein
MLKPPISTFYTTDNTDHTNYTSALKMATAMLGETLNNLQHSTRLIAEKRTTLNYRRERLMKKIKLINIISGAKHGYQRRR